jgi:shikimate 5-dehydrogenase
VQRRFFLLGSSDTVSALASGLDAHLRTALQTTCEPLPFDSGDSREFRAALDTEGFLGMQLPTRHSALCLPLCQDLSPAAMAAGVVDTVVRQENGRLYGDFLLAPAVRELLHSEGIAQVRTALLFGAGYAARATVVALKELGCARFVIGHLSQRRQLEMSQQMRRMRKQITFFPLEEMADFMAWAEASNAFVSDQVPPTEFSGAERAADKGAKRWELLVNTCDLGRDILSPAHPLSSHNFMCGVNRVLDITSIGEPSPLVVTARQLQVPALTGERLSEIHRELLFAQLERVVRGTELPSAIQLPRKRRYVMHRRKSV